MLKYETPEFELVLFEAEDIITDSQITDPSDPFNPDES